MNIFLHKRHFERIVTHILLVGAFLMFTGCAVPQPLLIQNSYYQSQGEEEAQRAIEHCQGEAPVSFEEKLALIQETTEQFREIGHSTGEATALLTNSASDMGAAFGDVIGTVIGLSSGIAKATKPNEEQKQAVRECLESRGFAVEGWG